MRRRGRCSIRLYDHRGDLREERIKVKGGLDCGADATSLYKK
jgi:hypothetical protein